MGNVLRPAQATFSVQLFGAKERHLWYVLEHRTLGKQEIILHTELCYDTQVLQKIEDFLARKDTVILLKHKWNAGFMHLKITLDGKVIMMENSLDRQKKKLDVVLPTRLYYRAVSKMLFDLKQRMEHLAPAGCN